MPACQKTWAELARRRTMIPTRKATRVRRRPCGINAADMIRTATSVRRTVQPAAQLCRPVFRLHWIVSTHPAECSLPSSRVLLASDHLYHLLHTCCRTSTPELDYIQVDPVCINSVNCYIHQECFLGEGMLLELWEWAITCYWTPS